MVCNSFFFVLEKPAKASKGKVWFQKVWKAVKPTFPCHDPNRMVHLTPHHSGAICANKTDVSNQYLLFAVKHKKGKTIFADFQKVQKDNDQEPSQVHPDTSSVEPTADGRDALESKLTADGKN